MAVLAFAPTYPGGVFVASGDVDGDGFSDLLVGAGTVGHVNVFSGRTGAGVLSFLTPEAAGGSLVSFGGTGSAGARVASVDVDGLADILTGSGGVVRAFKGTSLAELDNFFAYGPAFFGALSLGGG